MLTDVDIELIEENILMVVKVQGVVVSVIVEEVVMVEKGDMVEVEAFIVVSAVKTDTGV